MDWRRVANQSALRRVRERMVRLPPMTPEHRLFVYGTLAPGRSNAHVLADVPGTWEPATVRGTLHAEGWGAAAGYPAIVLDPRGGEVRGLLFTSGALPGHWRRLDAFEGEGYERVLTSARTEAGTLVEAYVYALRQTPG